MAKKGNYLVRGGFIALGIGIIGWIIFFSTYNCDWDMCDLGAAMMVLLALASLIVLWFIGLFFGWLYKNKKR
ncbi:MAG: hypothetical protein AABW51_03285 [Nanoarchaeota archaeon]